MKTARQNRPQGRPLGLRRLGHWLARYGLILALLLIGLGFSLAIPKFFTTQNVLLILRQISINAILAIGVTYVLLTGGVDLSLGSLVALTGVVAASFAHPGEYPLILPVSMGLLAGLGCGAINGAIVAWGGVAPFIVTLGMMSIARGLALVIAGGRPISNLSPEFSFIAGGNLFGIPIPIILLVAVAVGSHLVLNHLRLGRYVYAVGGNELAARASGINVHSVKMIAYATCGGLCGLAGVILASRITTGQPNAGLGYELDAIAAAVIGGTSLSGGVGGVVGTVLGAILLGIINVGLDRLNVSPYYQLIIKGLILVVAVWLDKRTEKSS